MSKNLPESQPSEEVDLGRPGIPIPDNDPTGVESIITFSEVCTINEMWIGLYISH